tara:strand:- start:823 stop:1347 length:525 start_codon:yes stop_codon:yes gene_type:complete
MKGYIYKIYDNTNGNTYYGSTQQQVSKRIADHKSDYNRWVEKTKTKKCSCCIIFDNNDYSYSTVEEVNYENKWELRNRERWYIENNKCVNKNIPNRTKKEYKSDNPDVFDEYNKNYYEENKVTLVKNNKNYYEENKEKILIQKKEYREKNKEKLKMKRKEKYQKKKEEKEYLHI